MSFNLKANKGQGGAEREQVPAGNAPAVLVALVDCGSQHDEFQGKASWRRNVLLVWELPTKKKKDGKSHTIDAVVTMSLNEKAKLRKWAESMMNAKISDGADFDITTLVGKACLVSVLHNEKGYARVEAVTGYPDGMPPPTATLAPFVCGLDEFQAGSKPLPEWVPWQWSKALGQRVSPGDYIRACKEIAGDGSRPQVPAGAHAGAGSSADPIPF
ncbi:hypothetical protein VT84_13890 [Gemmata sp. SH-PL17]|uniref:phage replication initiation protein, NGO0469 family n=1 Tax=Gemmata sp. SH-PL17 TaxID=1630693 RepID=UPI00078CB637|nr:hypothetical protein [Gemmata sp. SH-PL17]AMV25485.1 hypothetical protein VT84_13890 [Gemmata sp. SH-PL17]